jgi:hypothetical protein
MHNYDPHIDPKGLAPLALVCFAGAAFALFMLLTGCRLPPPGMPPTGPIACSVDAVQRCWPGAIGPVNTCLTSAGASGCLLGLIQPGGCMVENVIACLVRHQGAEFAHAAQLNPGDVRSARAAENARQFITERKYTFTKEGSP